MDPLSQGVLGAVASQNVNRYKHLMPLATAAGWLSGMAADLDVLIRSESDPLLSLEFHRQFTHSLFFIPFGGLICALLFYWLWGRRKGAGFGVVYLWCTLGYATHGLLDACTTYGTQLLWPLSNMRFAWNTVSIIDPLYTLPVLVFVVLAWLKKSRGFAVAALIWVCVYTCLGIIQRERAEQVGSQLAQSRGHEPVRLGAKPSFSNILLWKVVYDYDGHYYVDAVRAGVAPLIFEGSSIKKLDVEKDFPWLNPQSQQAKDIERFRWFSNDYLAVTPEDKNKITDVRYSMLPHEIKGLWGIELDPSANNDTHITRYTDRGEGRERFTALLDMLW